MDLFEDVKLTDTIKESLSKLLNRDLSAATFSSGSSFPTSLTEEMLGRLCNRTDLHCLYCLTSTNPVKWELVLDYSSKILNAQEVAAAYQPLNSNLTALSRLVATENKIPYFVTPDTMNLLPLTSYGKTLLSSSSVDDLRQSLGLGDIAVKSQIENDDLIDGSLTKNKLNFIPMEKSSGYVTGDIKETYDETLDGGWIKITKTNFTVGPKNSGATYAASDAETLFKLLWSNPKCQVLPSKGSTADADWLSGTRIIQLPDVYDGSVLGQNIWVKL